MDKKESIRRHGTDTAKANSSEGNTIMSDGISLAPGSAELQEYVLDHVFGLDRNEQNTFNKLMDQDVAVHLEANKEPEFMKPVDKEPESVQTAGDDAYTRINRYYKAQEGMKATRADIILDRAMSEAEKTPSPVDDEQVKHKLPKILRSQMVDKTIDFTEMNKGDIELDF